MLWPASPAIVGLLVRIGGALAIVAAIWLHGCSVGKAGEQRKAAQTEVERLQLVREEARRLSRVADQAAAGYEAERALIYGTLNATQGALDAALRQPPKVCPPTVGACVLPGALGLRLNAIDHAGEAAAPAAGTDRALPAAAGRADAGRDAR
jgi:hypothetical protein